MKIITKIAILLLSNALGFVGISLAFYVGQIGGSYGLQTTLSNPNVDHSASIALFFQRSMLTFLVCALFSLGYIAIKGTLRFAFLLAPALIPLIYGLSLMLLPIS